MANPSLGTATLRTQVDTAGLRGGLQTAARDIDQFADRSQQRLANIGRSITIGFAAATAAITATGGALFAAANRAASFADEVDKAALRTRLTRESVQELRFVTDQLGGSFANVETAIVGLTQRLAGAEQGGDRQAQAFERLGVALRGANGELRDTEDLFFDSLTALQGLTNETERAVLAQEVFGRSAASLGPLLAAGAGSVDELRVKARELGLVLDNDSIASLVRYKDELSAFQQQASATGRELSLQFLPILTDGVLPAVSKALDLFRALPAPVQRAGTAIAGLGTAATAATVALRLLGVPIAALFGPAGLIIGGVVALGTLALALSSGNRDSLTGAVKEANSALASGDSDSLTGALDKVIQQVDGPVRDTLTRFREDLIQTGQVGVEQALRIAAALAQANATSLGIQPRQFGSFAPVREAFVGAGADFSRLESALDAANFVEAIGLSNDVIRRLRANPNVNAQGLADEVAKFVRDLQDFSTNAITAALGPIDVGFSTPAASLATGSLPSVAGQTGTTAAAVLGDPAAEAKAWTGRLLTEVELGVREYGTAFDLLSPRLLSLQGEARDALAAFGFESDQFQDTLAKLRVVEDALRRLGFMVPEVRIPLPSVTVPDGGSSALARSLARDAFPPLLPLDQRLLTQQGGARPPSAEATAAFRDEVTAANRAADASRAAAVAAEAAARENALAADQQRRANLGRAVAEDEVQRQLEAYSGVLARQVAREAFPALLPADPDVAGRLLAQQGGARVPTADEAAAYRAVVREANEAAAALARLEQQVDFATRGVTGRGLNPVTDSFGRVVNPFMDPTGRQPGVSVEEPLKEGATKFADAAAEAARLERESAQKFALTVVNAGGTFANAITALARGDVGTGIAGLGSGAGAIIGAIPDPTGTAALIGAIIAVGSGILGGIIGSGQSQREQDRARAVGASARGAPAIEFNVNVQQSLNVQSLTDPASRAAVDGLLNETVNRITRVIEQNVIPRVNRLEAAVL